MDKQEIHELLQDVRIISFDVGFTLIHPYPPVGEVYAAIATKYGYPVDPGQVHQRFVKTWQQKTAKNRSKNGAHPLAAEDTAFTWWQDVFTRSIGDHIPLNCLEIIFKECFYEYGRGKYWQIYDDVIPVLKVLKEKFSLVVLSNWDQRLQQTLWELELTPYFKYIYISTQINYAKPQPEAFDHILKDLQIEAGSVLHIGDSLEEDFQAARSAGFKALHLSRSKKGDKRQNSHQISSLNQLI